MIAIIVYRLWFSRGRDKRLFVLLMSVYYLLCTMFVYSTMSGGEQSAGSRALSFRGSGVVRGGLDVQVRWTDRLLHLRRFCQSSMSQHVSSVSADVWFMTAVRRRVSACSAGDTADRRLLTALLRLSRRHDGDEDDRLRRQVTALCQSVVPASTAPPHGCVTGCSSVALERGVLTAGRPARAGWRHVLVVAPPAQRLAASYLTEQWPISGHKPALYYYSDGDRLNFSSAVDLLLTQAEVRASQHKQFLWSDFVPASAAPLSRACHVCDYLHGPVTLLHADWLHEELPVLGEQLHLTPHLDDDITTPVSSCTPAAPLQQLTRHLSRQLDTAMLRRLNRLYADDLLAFPLLSDRDSHLLRAPELGHDAF